MSIHTYGTNITYTHIQHLKTHTQIYTHTHTKREFSKGGMQPIGLPPIVRLHQPIPQISLLVTWPRNRGSTFPKIWHRGVPWSTKLELQLHVSKAQILTRDWYFFNSPAYYFRNAHQEKCFRFLDKHKITPLSYERLLLEHRNTIIYA